MKTVINHRAIKNNNCVPYNRLLLMKTCLGSMLFMSACNKQAMSHKMGNTDIQTHPQLHMATQITTKHLAAKDSIDRAQARIASWEGDKDQSGNAMGRQVRKHFQVLQQMLETPAVKAIGSAPASQVGFPIKTHKLDPQLARVIQWLNTIEDDALLSTITRKYINGLSSNEVSVDELPTLGAPSNQFFWGNSNASCNAVLLAGTQAALGMKDIDDMPGIATKYPWDKSNFQLEVTQDTLEKLYPFFSDTRALLFGDFQYGGHRRLSPLVFGPEDASSSVGKATGCAEYVKEFTTAKMRGVWGTKDNPFGYQSVVEIPYGSVTGSQLQEIEPGDIFLQNGHTAIVAAKPDQKGNVLTFEYNRDIDTQDVLGGGAHSYVLPNQPKPEQPVYILRSSEEGHDLRETSTLRQCLAKVRDSYKEKYPNGPEPTEGDAEIFLDN